MQYAVRTKSIGPATAAPAAPLSTPMYRSENTSYVISLYTKWIHLAIIV